MDEVTTQPSPETKKKMSPLIPAAIIVLVVLVGAGIVLSTPKEEAKEKISETPAAETTTAVTATQQETTMTPEKETGYKDGTYTIVGNYTSPGGAETLGVTLTFKDDIITEANVESQAERPNSKKFQGIFIENYKQFVVGKPIDEVKLDKVSGSSLSPKGFNDALEKIKTEAKA